MVVKSKERRMMNKLGKELVDLLRPYAGEKESESASECLIRLLEELENYRKQERRTE